MVYQVLLEYDRVYCFDFEERIGVEEVLKEFETQKGIPKECLYLTLNGKRMSPREDVPCAPSMLRARLAGGLKGGKGGFGAMLRSMGKGAGSKVTRDFGACRDLHGRRLRHVNQEIAIQKWNEEKEQRDQLLRNGMDAREIEDTATPSGIDGWHLETPSWAEGIKASKTKKKRKSAMCKEWLQARENAKAPDGAPKWWGCPRGRRCDFAHGENELIGRGLTDYKEKVKEEGRHQQIVEQDKYANYGDVDEEVSSAIAIGLKKRLEIKKRKWADTLTKNVSVLPVGAGSAAVKLADIAAASITPLFGQVVVHDNQVEGSSMFGTASVFGCYINKGKWYYEIELLTDGIMQLGWADNEFEGNSDSGDGVGDHLHSWAFDGVRVQKWNGESEDYGVKWSVGDIIGCYLNVDQGEIIFSLNGETLGVAFSHIACPNHPTTGSNGFFPAFSLEQGEAIRVNLGSKRFSYNAIMNDLSYTPVANALQGTVNEPSTEKADPFPLSPPRSPHVDSTPNAPENPTLLVSKVAQAVGLEKKAVETLPSPSMPAILKQTQEVKETKPLLMKPKRIDLQAFDSAEALQRIGMDGLKAALLYEGLKCGGTLEERARRLFSIKGLSVEQVDPKIKAKKQ